MWLDLGRPGDGADGDVPGRGRAQRVRLRDVVPGALQAVDGAGPGGALVVCVAVGGDGVRGADRAADGGHGSNLAARSAPAVSAAAVIIGGMPEHRWAPPIHPDPPEDQPLGIPAPPAPDRVSGYPAVWVRVEFTRSGPQTCPGFVEQADGDVVYVQLVHMGFVHHVWLPMDRIKKRALKPQGRR
ncbi:conserved hypothetical protein [Exiguobacterium sp. 8A]|nr:conserved hypothetical protein [Exiguobacterium sp. 8A]